MCGIAGLWTPYRDAEKPVQLVSRMIASMAHRGPDDRGHSVFFTEPDGCLVFGHCRLAVIDLSPTGHQPMSTASGRYHIVFNGEIYNFKELRRTLESKGYPFQGRSDTEVILACCDHWGFSEALRRLRGMFGFALWDQRDQVLHLARDPVGEKPLYYGWTPQGFVFASDLGALSRVAKVELCWPALRSFLRYAYVPAPWSAYSGIYKLPSGTFLTLPAADLRRQPEFSPFPEKARCSPMRFWDLVRTALEGRKHAFSDANEAIDALDNTLNESVSRLRIADVPLGTFLSGGIDSTLVTSIAAAQSRTPIQTFTVGFSDPRFNEAEFAAEVAKHLGTRHTEHYVTEQDLLELVPQLSRLYSEPFADASQLPSVMISRIARQKVTVCLSGDGGDELFGGYNRYLLPKRVHEMAQTLPFSLRRFLGSLLNTIPAALADGVYNSWKRISGQKTGQSNIGQKVHKLASLLQTFNLNDGYHHLIAAWPPPWGRKEEPELTQGDFAFEEWAMLRDQLTYLPDDDLAKVDRASMSASLETRLPLLTREVVEFAWRVPLHMKLRQGQSKWILRQILYRYIPRELVNRPKMGFSVPMGRWLRGPLWSWAESLISAGRSKYGEHLPMNDILYAWRQHQSGMKDHGHRLWTALVLIQWLQDERYVT